MSTTRVIGNRFEINESIGQGGMGDVFCGTDRQNDATVAIKQLKTDIVTADPGVIERFEREGEALRQLDHPNIVKVLASVEEEGQHYLVMEYVGGGSLRDALTATPQLPIRRVLDLALDMADALTRAHRLHIIHRDIKPANVLLADDGTPRLTDFGVARLGNRTRLTETGSVIGTIAYLSPEGCLGNELDARTDVWSLGVMLYEMLAGCRPFERESVAATVYAVVNQPPPDLRELRPDTPPALADLIHRMLAKDPDQRVRSVRQVGAELENILHTLDTPVVGPLLATAPPTRFAPATPSGSMVATPALQPESAPIDETHVIATADQPSDRRRARGLIAGGVALGLIAATLILVLVLVDTGDDGSSTTVALVDPVGSGEYMVLVAQLEPLGEVVERDVRRFIVEDLEQTLKNDIPFSNIRIRAYPQMITSEAQAQAAAAANNATIIVWGNYTPDYVEVKVQIGVTDAFEHLHFDRTTLERSANFRVRLTNEHEDSVVLPVVLSMEMLFMADGDNFELTRLVSIIDELGSRVDVPDIVGTGIATHHYYGKPLYVSDTPKAIEEYSQALALDPGNPIYYAMRGDAYLRVGDFERAQRDLETALKLGPDGWSHPLQSLGDYTQYASGPAAALVYFDQIVAMRPDDWYALTYRGGLLYRSGEYDLAQADIERAIELGPEANFPYLVANALALRQGRITDAQAMVRATLTEFPDPTFANRLLEAAYADSVPNALGSFVAAGGHLFLGQYEEALEDAADVLTLDDQLVDAYLVQGFAHCNLGDYAAAEAAYDAALTLDPDYAVLYLLRAEARVKQQDMAGSMTDMLAAGRFDLGPEYDALLQAATTGAVGCQNFFEYDLLGSEADATPAGE